MNTVPSSAEVAERPVVLEIGKPYPLPLATTDGAVACFLTRGGSILQIALPGMVAHEESLLRNGTVRAGLLKADAALLWLFQFLRSVRTPALTFDCPFDIRRFSAAERDIPTIELRSRRLPIQIHAVDEHNVLRVNRGISLTSELSREFLHATLHQLDSSRSGETAHMLWNRRNPAQLVAQCRMQVCGTGGLLRGLLGRK